jgi:hypothetical protein
MLTDSDGGDGAHPANISSGPFSLATPLAPMAFTGPTDSPHMIGYAQFGREIVSKAMKFTII